MLVMLVGVVLPGNCKEIQTELVMSQLDPARLDASPNEHGPQIAFS